MKAEKRNRLDKTTVCLMVAVSVCFDVAQWILLLIPIAGWIMSFFLGVFAWLTFYTWTSIKGWGVSDSIKQIVVRWFLPAVEVIPILNVLPMWTIRTILQLSLLKAEDVLYNTTHGKVDVENIANRLHKHRRMLE